MSTIWIIGRKATIVTNGHEYMTEPFIAFLTEADADAAIGMVAKVSGETPMKAEVTIALPTPVSREAVAAFEALTKAAGPRQIRWRR